MIDIEDTRLKGNGSPEVKKHSDYVVSPGLKPYFEAVLKFLSSIADEANPNVRAAKEAVVAMNDASAKYDEAIRTNEDINVAIKQLAVDDIAISTIFMQFDEGRIPDFAELEDPSFYADFETVISEREEWLTIRMADFAACKVGELLEGNYNSITRSILAANQGTAGSNSLRLEAFMYRLASNSGVSELWDDHNLSHLAA